MRYGYYNLDTTLPFWVLQGQWLESGTFFIFVPFACLVERRQWKWLWSFSTVWWWRLSQLAHLDFIWNPEQGYYLKYPWLIGCSYHVAVPLVSGQKAGLCGGSTRASRPRFSIPRNSAELTKRPRRDWELSAEVSPKETSSCQLTYWYTRQVSLASE